MLVLHWLTMVDNTLFPGTRICLIVGLVALAALRKWFVCAEITLTKLKMEIWGEVEWFGHVFTVPKIYRFVKFLAATVYWLTCVPFHTHYQCLWKKLEEKFITWFPDSPELPKRHDQFLKICIWTNTWIFSSSSVAVIASRC